MNDNQTKFQGKLSQLPSKYWELILTAILTATLTAILQAYGDKTFDSLVAVLGKRLCLQITALILCSLGYCVFLLVRNEKNKLKHLRRIYWSSGDPLPFCPNCYDDSQKRIHLFPSLYNKDPRKEHYECHLCNHNFVAWDGKDFSPHFDNFRAAMKKTK